MILRELIAKVDKDIPVCVMKFPSDEIIFGRKSVSDIVPGTWLDMEVKSIFEEFGTLYVRVRKTKNGSFGEFLNGLSPYDCIKVRIFSRDGKPDKELQANNIYLRQEYSSYLLRKVSISGNALESMMIAVIEPDDDSGNEEG